MKVLICGNSGFIGSHLTPLLAERGHQVHGLDLREPQLREGLAGFTQGDIRKPEDLRDPVAGMDCVINLAAKHHDFGIEYDEYFETNERGTKTLLDAMANAGVQRHVFTSTVAVYGTQVTPPDEESTPDPENAYGKSKLAGEKVIHQWLSENPERAAVIFRPSVVYGERNLANMYSLIHMLNRGKFLRFGSGKVVKSVVYVGNLVRAIAMAMEQMSPGARTFNYVDKPDLPTTETVGIICDELGRRPPRVAFPLWLGLFAGGCFDVLGKITGKHMRISAARVRKLATSTQFQATAIREYGFEPSFTIEEGLRRMVRWYKEEGIHLADQAGGPSS